MLEYVKLCDEFKIQDGIIFDFYVGLPHMLNLILETWISTLGKVLQYG